jgi:hypothetical protein
LFWFNRAMRSAWAKIDTAETAGYSKDKAPGKIARLRERLAEL